MKKILQLFAMLCIMVFGTQVSFAWESGSHTEDVYDGDALMSIQTLAIGNPYYTPQGGEPSREDFTAMLYDQAVKTDKQMNMVYKSYIDVCQAINQSEHIDIYRLERHKALSVFKPQIKFHADAYVVATVSNDTRLNIFYEVVDAKTGDVLYVYRKLAPKKAERDELLYKEMTASFYSDLQSAIKKLKREKAKEDEAIMKMGKEKYMEYKAQQMAKKKKTSSKVVKSSFEEFKENGPRLGQGHKVE